MKQKTRVLPLLVVLLAMLVAPLAISADTMAPGDVIQAVIDAYFARDFDLVESYYAENAVMTITNSGQAVEGSAAIRAFYESRVALDYVPRLVVEKVEGDKVHTHGYHTSDNTRALGLAAEEAQSDSVWTIRDGIIYRQDYTWTDETMAAMAKAQSAAEATELPKTGVAPAVSTLTWVLALAGVAIAAVVSLTLWRKKARR